jgi:hypothetical protein
MRFNQAIEKMEQGKKVKRKHWVGYWQLEDGAEDKKIMMHCKDGQVLEVRETKDILFTLRNVSADDWVVVDR